jgi:hypothetical protein
MPNVAELFDFAQELLSTVLILRIMFEHLTELSLQVGVTSIKLKTLVFLNMYTGFILIWKEPCSGLV